MNTWRRVLLVGLVVTSVLAASVANASAATDGLHTVKSGETLHTIALKYKTTVGYLAALNNIVDANFIYAGQRLRVGGSPHNMAENKPIFKDGPWWGEVVVEKVPIRAHPTDEGIISDPQRPGLDDHLYHGDTVQVLGVIMGKEILVGNPFWYLIDAEDHQYVYSAHITPIELPEPPPHGAVGSQDRWIGVYLDRQLIVAYEGATVIYRTLVSGGKLYPTPRGVFHINGDWRPATRRMRGGEPGTSDYYDLPNVRWVSYFTSQGHALHGAYWHHRFGRPMSHGCLNMTNYDAGFFYEWAPAGTAIVIS